MELTVCRCDKSSCKSNRLCVCYNNEMACTEACGCMGDESCQNPHTSQVSNDDNESDEDNSDDDSCDDGDSDDGNSDDDKGNDDSDDDGSDGYDSQDSSEEELSSEI